MLEKLNPYIRYARIQKLTESSKKLCMGHDNRLFVCLEGEANAKVCKKNPQSDSLPTDFDNFTISAGNALFINAYTPYSFYGYTDDDGVLMLVLNFDLTDEFSCFSELHHTFEYSLWDGVKKYAEAEIPLLEKPRFFAESQSVVGLLTRITDMFREEEPADFYRDISSAYLKTALISMLSEQTTAKPAPVRRAMEYIRASFKTEISNEDVAKFVGYHPYHLNRLFKKHLGTGLRDYIINYRLREAQNRLAETDLPVAFVASECGFSDVSYFSQCFRKRIGNTPKEYRQKNKLM